MNNEEIVKAKWPDAFCHLYSRGWHVMAVRYATLRRVTYNLSGYHNSEEVAWAKAAARISESEDGK